MKKWKKALVTGGAGFIGTNLVAHLLKEGWKVTVFDNLSRRGSARNLEWLRRLAGPSVLEVTISDIRDFRNVKRHLQSVDACFHLAAQVAVTTSITNPREDFEVNALGTLNVLEAARKSKRKPIIIFASTNKVYGGMEGLKVKEGKTRYSLPEYPQGIGEDFPLDFHSPYGCSNGAADQYTRDYFRIYGLPTVVFRQSCIYGPRQMGIEDQGWMAHFVISGLLGRPITIYGSGNQVRDMLYVDDLIDAFLGAINKIDKVKGEIFNIGGGAKNSLSLLEFIEILERKIDRKIKLKFAAPRAGDQKVFISDTSKLEERMGWRPKVPLEKGIDKLIDWVESNMELFKP